MTPSIERPKLRQVERIEQQREDEHLVVVRDPLDVSPPFAIDAMFAPVLDLLDGTRTVAQVRQSLRIRGQLDIPLADLEAFVVDLRDAGVLDDGVFRSRWNEIHGTFLASNKREPRLAGTLYPADPQELRQHLETTIPRPPRFHGSATVGVVAPHGPPSWTASVLRPLAERLPDPTELDLIVVLGTDHGRGLLPYAVTGKHYVTPLALTRTDTTFVDRLERRLDWVRREEIRHRQALSIELSVLFLQHLYADHCPPVVPVLCGSTVFSPGQRAASDRFIADLEALTEGRRVLWWTSAELSHAGPAYGREPLGEAVRVDLQSYDKACLGMLLRGGPERFEQCAFEAGPAGPASGAAAMATLLRVLPVGVHGELIRYEQIPPPGSREGLAGIASAAFAA